MVRPWPEKATKYVKFAAHWHGFFGAIRHHAPAASLMGPPLRPWSVQCLTTAGVGPGSEPVIPLRGPSFASDQGGIVAPPHGPRGSAPRGDHGPRLTPPARTG